MAARPPSRRILRPNTIFHDLASTQSATSANERRRKPVFRRGVQVGARKRRVKRLVPGGKPGVGGRWGEALARGATGLWHRRFCWPALYKPTPSPRTCSGVHSAARREAGEDAVLLLPGGPRNKSGVTDLMRRRFEPHCCRSLRAARTGNGVDGDSPPSADLPSPSRGARHISGKGAFAVNAMISSMIDRPADRPQSR
jgi:hypothetical protein